MGLLIPRPDLHVSQFRQKILHNVKITENDPLSAMKTLHNPAVQRYRGRTIYSNGLSNKIKSGYDQQNRTFDIAAFRPGPTPASYQGDTILLQAKVRFGKISYEDVDVLQRKPGWRPSEKQKSDVMEDLKSDAVCIVTFYQTLDGLVSYSHYKRKPLDRWVFYLYFLIWRCIVSCFEVLFRLFWSVLRQM